MMTFDRTCRSVAAMAVEIEAARLLTWKSVSILDNDEHNTLVSSRVKRFAADAAMKVATDAVQVCEAMGSSRTTR
jgi:acyl-CoA dehydrogenase